MATKKMMKKVTKNDGYKDSEMKEGRAKKLSTEKKLDKEMTKKAKTKKKLSMSKSMKAKDCY
ncbi:MAG TPA: hypothetical protein VIJ14_00095 [Rhabdochlamydiaceae bacterium]